MIRRVSDGVVTIRSFRLADRTAVLAGRDAEWDRWLGPGSPAPSPTASILVGGDVVGWVDADRRPPWLQRGEVNIGYSVFAPHRGQGYASRAVRLLLAQLPRKRATRALFVIDARNEASQRVAVAVGAHRLDRGVAAFPGSIVYAVDLRGD